MRRTLAQCACLALSALALGACGGGGGGGAPTSSGSGSGSGAGSSGGGAGGGTGGGGTGGGSGSGGTPEPTLLITEANALQLISLAFNDAELLEINAELMVSGAAMLQLSATNPLDLDCPNGVGDAYIEHVDADASGTLSTGDDVVLVIDDCFDLTVDGTLNVTALSQSGRSFDEIQGQLQVEFTFAGSGPEPDLVASQALQFSVGNALVRWLSTDGSVSGSGVETRNLIVEKSLVPETFEYSVAIAGIGDLTGAIYEFETTADFSGDIDFYPDRGRLLLSGANSAAEVTSSGSPGARFRVDALGTGQFGSDQPFDWRDIGIGPLFEVSGAETDDVPPGITDLISRSWDLHGTVADAAVDAERNLIYFSITDRNEIAAVDMDTLLVTERIAVGSGPKGLWLSDGGDVLYAALSHAGAVSALNLETRAIETVVVAAAADSTAIAEVVETQPGIVFATGEGQIGGEFSDLVYIARVDFNEGNAVSRVANGRDIATGSVYASLFPSPDRQSVFVGGASGLFELDAASVAAPIVQEQAEPRTASYAYAMSPNGNRIYAGDGGVVLTAGLQRIGTMGRGFPYPVPDGSAVAYIGTGRVLGGAGMVPDRFEFNFEFYSTATFDFLDRFAIVCDLEEGIRGSLPLPDEGEWLFYGPAGICAADIFDSANPPGADEDNPPPDPVERITVTSSQVNLPGVSWDMIYDPLRGRLYFSNTTDENILAYSADTLELVDTFDLPDRATKMDLAPAGNELAILFQQSDDLGFLNLDTGVVDTLVPDGAITVDHFQDVAYTGPDDVYAIAFLSFGATNPDLIRLSRDNDPAPVEVGSGIAGQLLELGNASTRLYVTARNPFKLFALDLTQPQAPVILEADADTSPVFGFAISPTGGAVAMREGEVFRTSDLVPMGIIGKGVVAFSGDGSLIAQSLEVGEIHLFNANTVNKVRIVETGCGESTSEIIQHMPEFNAWVILVGSRICVVPMPGSSMQMKPGLKPRPMYSPDDYCDSDCQMRRLITRRVLDLRLLSPGAW